MQEKSSRLATLIVRKAQLVEALIADLITIVIEKPAFRKLKVGPAAVMLPVNLNLALAASTLDFHPCYRSLS
jgi:hypothetical protein